MNNLKLFKAKSLPLKYNKINRTSNKNLDKILTKSMSKFTKLVTRLLRKCKLTSKMLRKIKKPHNNYKKMNSFQINIT